MHFFLFLFGFWCFENIISEQINQYACSTKNLADLERKSQRKNIKEGITAGDVLVALTFFLQNKKN